MEMNFKMTEEESVRLYQFLSSEYAELDIPMRELLHKLEKELFSSFTISQIESIQLKTSGEN
ncbi:hypothetical protein DV872_10650 [Oceanispirochaeta sp. M1]|nr:hypothetical protein DV872_10650 [Oceanispirochaeta sp. M1]